VQTQMTYVPDDRHPNPDRDDPLIKQLFGYKRVHLAAGASTSVKFTVTSETLALTDRASGDRVSVPGR